MTIGRIRPWLAVFPIARQKHLPRKTNLHSTRVLDRDMAIGQMRRRVHRRPPPPRTIQTTLIGTPWPRNDSGSGRVRRRHTRMSDTDQCENTNRELWRGPDEGCGDYYADSIHFTKDGDIGINCGGFVYVKP